MRTVPKLTFIVKKIDTPYVIAGHKNKDTYCTVPAISFCKK